MRSARNALKVRVLTDSETKTFCNEGIVGWATERLGPYDIEQSLGDSWFGSGARRLEVFDLRKEGERPAPEELQNLTSSTAGAVKWRFKESGGVDADVTILGNLKLLTPASEKQDDVATALTWGALFHRRVRRQFPESKVVVESRRSIYTGETDDVLAGELCKLTSFIEGLSSVANALSYSPNTGLLRSELQRSLYCAVSASVADPASFFNINEDAYLWEFDMPSPGAVSGPSHGYYLLARQTSTILEAVRKTLAVALPATSSITDTALAKLMREASSRGTPELRKWAAGGAGASGEIGLIVALRLLQGARGEQQVPGGLLGNDPAITNLLIPIDPFEDPINALRGGHSNSYERPDILIASIRLHVDGGVFIRLTPIEVKYRSAPMTEGARQAALHQATEFGDMLDKLCGHRIADGAAGRLWALAKSALIADLIEFGYRIESNLSPAASSQQDAARASAVLAAILGDRATIEVDKRGRLILIDHADESRCLDQDGSGLSRTVELSQQDAVALLAEEQPALIESLRGVVSDWELTASAGGAEASDTVVLKPEKAIASKAAASGDCAPAEDSGGLAGSAVPALSDHSSEQGRPPAELVASGLSNGEGKMILPLSSQGDRTGEGVRFAVGRSANPLSLNQEYCFWPSNTELTQLNVGILGDLGTGKTQMIKGLIYRLVSCAGANRGERVKFLILDYKGDYIDDEFKARVGATVYKPQLLPINLFDLSGIQDSLTPWLDRFNFFSDTLAKIHNVAAPVQKERLKQAVRAAYESAKARDIAAPTIYDVFEEYKAIVGGAVDTTYSILSNLIDRQVFEPSLAKIRPFSELLNGVFVLDLKSLGPDDQSKNMLVAIFLNLFYEYMLSVPKKKYIGTSPQLRALDSVLLVDEADNIMQYDFKVLNRILVEDREFGVGVWLSSQYLDHFNRSDIDYTQPLLTWFIHRVPNISMNQLRSIGLSGQAASNDTLERIKTLKKHECFYRSFGADGKFMRGYPYYELVAKEGEGS